MATVYGSLSPALKDILARPGVDEAVVLWIMQEVSMKLV
jgi:hypothetical protein